MAFSAADVTHGAIDCLINGQPYVFADSLEELAVFGLTSPFIPRTSVQTGSSGQPGYGDSDTEFFQTFTQKDWSKGEQQKYVRLSDEDSPSRYWMGEAIDVRQAGQATIRQAILGITAPAAFITNTSSEGQIYAVSSTTGYSVADHGAVTSKGVHGLGVAPTTLVPAVGSALFLSSVAGGTVGVRKWVDTTFTTFSATPAGSLAVLNNTLYGGTNTSLIRYDTAGVATTLFTWQDPSGAAVTPVGSAKTILEPFGGRLLIYRGVSDEDLGALYLYDGTAPAKIMAFPDNFDGASLCVALGSVFISGYQREIRGTTTVYRPVIYYYSSGTQGKLWSATTPVAAVNYPPAMVKYGDGIVWNDDTTGNFLYYNSETGGASTLAGYTVATGWPYFASSGTSIYFVRGSTSTYLYPDDVVATTGSLKTSLIDLDSSLTKAFRGITVEWDDDASDTGATVDISYRVGDVDGSYTSLQVGAVSGTEYTLTGVTGKSISVRVQLNKSGSTLGPTLKRIRVRAVPMRQSFRDHTFVLNLAGKDGRNITFRNGRASTRDGDQMLADLRAAAAAAAPFDTTDTTGTYKSVISELRATAVRPREYVAAVRIREV